MIFSTYAFIFLFLPVTFFGYRLLCVLKLHSLAKLWLVLASLAFYAIGSAGFVLVFIASVFFNYVVGNLIIKADGPRAALTRRILLTVGLVENIALLGYYKYTNFMINNYILLTGHTVEFWNIVLPIGISFFTFQLIAYLVDCYRGEAEDHSVLHFLLFITFFPQLIVGPIVHHKEIIPQFNNADQPLFNKNNFMLGLFIFCVGCAKKVVLADPLTAFGEQFYADVAGADVATAWVAVLSYTLSYYFDLSGYADMAIGLGLLFNIRLPQNFESPYKARNFREYWQRWHMSLSRFLNDYVFRTFYRKGRGSFNFYSAVMITFLVSGFWHGAGWNFVLWGIVNGIFVCMAHFMRRNGLSLPGPLAWLLCFAGVVGTRILFVSSGTTQAIAVFRKLFDFSEFSGMTASGVVGEIAAFAAYNLYILVLLAVAMGIAFFAKNTRQITENFRPNAKFALWGAFLFVLALSQMTTVSDFLYFQF